LQEDVAPVNPCWPVGFTPCYPRSTSSTLTEGSDGTSIDGDPLDRYTVSSVAGKERGREETDPVDANDELWGLD